jgi:hypothetical protein
VLQQLSGGAAAEGEAKLVHGMLNAGGRWKVGPRHRSSSHVQGGAGWRQVARCTEQYISQP